MVDILALLLVGAAFGAALLFHAKEASAWRSERAALLDAARAERKDLEDRIMSANWGQYLLGQDGPSVEVPQLTTDAAEAAWHEENKRKHPELYPDEVIA